MATRQVRRQLQFSSFEMAMIAVSFLVTVTTVFFLGLFVGKKNASWHAPAEDRVARIPVDDFTKYKRPAPIEKPKERQAEAAPADTKPAEPAAVAAAAETAKSAAALPSAAVAAVTPPPLATAPPAAAADATKPAATTTAAADAAAKDAAKAREAAAAKAAKEKEKEEAPTGRGYTVQILSTRKQADADALVAKLKSRGYGAYIKKMSDGAGAWYRVRVGSYGAFGEAKGMADKCRRDLGLGQAFVSTE